MNPEDKDPVQEQPQEARPADEQDFLAGSQACNLEDGACEACQ